MKRTIAALQDSLQSQQEALQGASRKVTAVQDRLHGLEGEYGALSQRMKQLEERAKRIPPHKHPEHVQMQAKLKDLAGSQEKIKQWAREWFDDLDERITESQKRIDELFQYVRKRRWF